jgi:Zn-dependent protease with chaperone function
VISRAILVLGCLVAATPAWAQFGRILDEGTKRAKQAQDLRWTEEEEQELGAGVSARVREKYGVVQDEAVHRYVTLVGAVLAEKSTRPALPWQFIVLDTDGVNAFAAPGGYIHITRGALGLAKSEAELAGILGHEIVHITDKHTIKALQKSKAAAIGAEEMNQGGALMDRLISQATDMVLTGFGRGEELESDAKGVVLASKAGYAPAGLSQFLSRLAERNQASTEKQGLFASHPAMKERLEKIAGTIARETLTGSATLEPRYAKFILYTATPLTDVMVAEAGTAGLAGGSSKKKPEASAAPKDGTATTAPAEEPKKKRSFGVAKLLKTDGAEEQKSAEVVGSGGSRGVDRERDAKGGGNPAAVAVKLTPADIGAFKKDGGLS